MKSFKEHITLDQLKEVDSSVIARNLIKTKLVDYPKDELIRKTKFAERITVGKMFEILSKHEFYFGVTFNEGNWGIFHDRGMGPLENHRECLCDLLWEAVKLTLDEQEATHEKM